MKNFLAVLLTLLSISAYGQSLARYNWTRLPISVGADAYIDLSRLEGDKVFGFKVVTLLSFDQISSAQMWGLSDVSELSVNCSKGTVQYLKTTWTEKQMAAGAVDSRFNLDSWGRWVSAAEQGPPDECGARQTARHTLEN